MNCAQPISYVIKKGDNLYRLSRYYQTTVTDIMTLNPGIDPYFLQVGTTLEICPGDRFIYQFENNNPPACPNPMMQIDLMKEMRKAWTQHVYWTRLFMISVVEGLENIGETEAQLLKNPKNIADIFRKFYSEEDSMELENLITEHLKIGGGMIVAATENNQGEFTRLNTEWYINADAITELLSSMNPYLNKNEIRQMLYSHLDMTKEEVSKMINKDFSGDIAAFNMIENDILKFADYLNTGIMSQFPQMFY